MQPAPFYLEAPTLLHVFIFIALCALRLEARFVVLAGLVAALGWTLPALYAVSGPDGMKTFARDYVPYTTSNSALISAEVDQVVSILTVTAIIAVVIGRARFFAPEITQQITAYKQEVSAGEGQVREAATLFTEIRGFAVFAKTVDPDMLMGHLPNISP